MNYDNTNKIPLNSDSNIIHNYTNGIVTNAEVYNISSSILDTTLCDTDVNVSVGDGFYQTLR